ncbi:hypothetical protein ACO1O0_008745 [Amphichorda felina]
MADYFSKLSLVPTFPEYTGPFKVGTVDVEVAVADLNAPSPAPGNAADIHTVQFRIFYPAVPESDENRIRWLPKPQRHHVSAYTKFMGIGHTAAKLLSFFPRHLHYTAIPAQKNAAMLAPETENQRWPTMIFSHGLAGTRNSYSYVAGSLASHGVVVFCPEHRDGSAVCTFIRLPDDQNRFLRSRTRRAVPYHKVPREVSPETYEAREAQLRIRLWEMGLIHEAILAIDQGSKLTNLNASTPSLGHFAGRLHVHEPGSIIFGGHSFGAATMTQLLKSTYYADNADVAGMAKPLFTPDKGSEIRKQITEKTVTMLLDMWCMPLLGPNSKPLFDFPLPVYDDLESAAGGTALLVVESEAFYKWTEQLHVKARILSPDPKVKTVSPALYERPSGIRHSEPNFFYVVKSAHVNQSDFGILFPWLTKKFLDAEQPERALRLNLRAQLQLLRANGIPVARTSAEELVDGAHIDLLDAVGEGGVETKPPSGLDDDRAIFDRTGTHVVDHWKWIDTMGLGDAGEKEKGKTVGQQVEEGEEKMKGELEPSEQDPQSVVRALGVTAAVAAA